MGPVETHEKRFYAFFRLGCHTCQSQRKSQRVIETDITARAGGGRGLVRAQRLPRKRRTGGALHPQMPGESAQQVVEEACKWKRGGIGGGRSDADGGRRQEEAGRGKTHDISRGLCFYTPEEFVTLLATEEAGRRKGRA